jgi:hypothetical protein
VGKERASAQQSVAMHETLAPVCLSVNVLSHLYQLRRRGVRACRRLRVRCAERHNVLRQLRAAVCGRCKRGTPSQPLASRNVHASEPAQLRTHLSAARRASSCCAITSCVLTCSASTCPALRGDGSGGPSGGGASGGGASGASGAAAGAL